ncbi:MAG TPA: hypothetical protein VK616_06590 [Flavitalea sp.]|nr:hypothetical protein [Flavitalea sp.]
MFGLLIGKSSEDLASTIDQNKYDESELIEVKLRLNLPYVTSQGDYEKYEGEITINGHHHNYVKRKVSGDTLYLLCLPNREKDKLQIAENNYGTVTNDFDSEHKSESAVKKANTFNQYPLQLSDYSILAPQISFHEPSSFISLSLPDSFIDLYGKPPQLNS